MDISLKKPFNGDFPVTFSFGAWPDNTVIADRMRDWGLLGHNGIDYGLPRGTPVLAAADGVVVHAGEKGDFGRSVILKHSWGKSLYAHLSKISIAIGDKIKAGGLLGKSGQSGAAFGPHLHFSIKPVHPNRGNGFYGYIDPSPYFVARSTNIPSSYYPHSRF